MKNFILQPYHLVLLSPWPLLTSFNLMFLMIGSIKLFNTNNLFLMNISLILMILCSFQWWRDVIRESSYQGFHTMLVINGLKLGMILFIISEIFFFISFFWTYFHMFLSPSIEIGSMWPPFYFNKLIMSPYTLPLLNTILLVSSGMFLSMAHYSLIMKNNFFLTLMLILLTIYFGLIFTFIQIQEYLNANFSIFNSNYGAIFFMMTGFHGIHVIIGTVFIIISFLRMMNFQYSNIHHFAFEASAWYWHFVDVVWLFLFLFLYWWPF